MESRQSIFLVLLLLVLCKSVLPAPITHTEPSYKSNPDGRGTIALLWSCTITFGLCIWTAIHPDVVPWQGFWNKTFYKLSWMSIALLVPEFIVCCAVSQLTHARRIRRYWKEHFEDYKDKDVQYWLGMPSAFFVVMGGFVLQKNKNPEMTSTSQNAGCGASSSPRQEGEKDTTTIICPAGFEKLLKTGILREGIEGKYLTEAQFASRYIADKGKADGVAKLLVVIQILWMAVQCIGRKLTGLPVTLLEIHILTQILFSAITYICWWNKPLDVGEPIALSLDAARLAEEGIVVEQESFTPYPLLDSAYTRQGGLIRMFNRMVYDLLGSFVVTNNGSLVVISATILGMINCGIHAAAWNTHFPTSIEALLWRIASVEIGSMTLLLGLSAYGLGSEIYIKWTLHDFRSRNKTFYHVLFEACHRAVHRLRPREVPAEKKLGFSDCVPPWMRYLHLGAIVLFTLGYFFSVFYLTIASFVSVRSLPEGAYATVGWSDFFPHL